MRFWHGVGSACELALSDCFYVDTVDENPIDRFQLLSEYAVMLSIDGSPSSLYSYTKSSHSPRLPMKALVKEGGRVAVQSMPRPRATAPNMVVVRVTIAGLCRTDLYAAEGKIKTCNPLILGHEFAGIVDEVGEAVKGVQTGDRVTVNPMLACSICNYCTDERHHICQSTSFLGVDRAGCFADYIAVPESAIYKLPDTITDLAAAYAEPVAASLAVMKTGIKCGERGLIYGRNRFSQLMEKILAVYGISNVEIYDPSSEIDVLEENAYDYVIETSLTTTSMQQLVRAIRPGGKIVLKSRQYEPVEFKMIDLLKKEPIMHVANYGPFDEAVDLLASGKVNIDDLVDGVYDLADFKRVLHSAKQQEALKPFFNLMD